MQTSLDECDDTVVSIFVNPAQFAPHEDLASYPRTLPTDLAALQMLRSSNSPERGVSIVFAPSAAEMYPSGLTQVVADQVGAFVEVRGLSHQMEGGSRPSFFRGVATVCTKLFHMVEPDAAYFGQKDIQQALILRRMLKDLRFSYPPTPEDLHVCPTARDQQTGLALSSRNAYLSEKTRCNYAPALHRALQAGRSTWHSFFDNAPKRIAETLRVARESLQREAAHAMEIDGVRLHLDYITLNDPDTLADLEQQPKEQQTATRAIISGAVLASDVLPDGTETRVTRLIDNELLGFKL